MTKWSKIQNFEAAVACQKEGNEALGTVETVGVRVPTKVHNVVDSVSMHTRSRSWEMCTLEEAAMCNLATIFENPLKCFIQKRIPKNLYTLGTWNR